MDKEIAEGLRRQGIEPDPVKREMQLFLHLGRLLGASDEQIEKLYNNPERKETNAIHRRKDWLSKDRHE